MEEKETGGYRDEKALRYNFRCRSVPNLSSSNQDSNFLSKNPPSKRGNIKEKDGDFSETKTRFHETISDKDSSSTCKINETRGGGSENICTTISSESKYSKNRRSNNFTPNSESCSTYENNLNDNCSSINKATKEHRIRDEIGADGKWEIRTYTGYIVTLQVNLDRDMPKNFLSDKAAVMWHTANEINLIRLKHQVQNGEYIPDDAIVKVDKFLLKRPNINIREMVVESEETRKEKVKQWGNKRETALLKELSVVEMALDLRDCFCGEHQLERGLTLLNKFDKLELTPLILKKNPFIVDTLRCLCSYQKVSELDKVEILTDSIQKKAKEIYHKIQMLFKVRDGSEFKDCFEKQSSFLWRMHGFEVQRVYQLVNDPTLPILDY